MTLKLTDNQRALVRKMVALDANLRASDIIQTISSMNSSNARTQYLKKKYTVMLERGVKNEVAVQSTPFSLDLLDTARLAQEQGHKVEVAVQKEIKKVESNTQSIQARELTVSEIISIENTCIEFLLENPDADPSNIDLSVYQQIDQKGFNLLLNHVKMIHRLLSFNNRINATACKACNLPFSSNRNEKIFLVADNFRKLENNEFRCYHESCFLEKKQSKQLNIEELLAPRVQKTPVPNDIEMLKEQLETISKLIPSEITRHDKVFEITVYTTEFNYEMLIFDSETGKLYLDEQEISFLEDLSVV
jgi:ABC-type transporter Mla MlaB component